MSRAESVLQNFARRFLRATISAFKVTEEVRKKIILKTGPFPHNQLDLFLLTRAHLTVLSLFLGRKYHSLEIRTG